MNSNTLRSASETLGLSDCVCGAVFTFIGKWLPYGDNNHMIATLARDAARTLDRTEHCRANTATESPEDIELACKELHRSVTAFVEDERKRGNTITECDDVQEALDSLEKWIKQI